MTKHESVLFTGEGARLLIVGNGSFSYRVDVGWGQLPNGYEFGEVAGVASDSHGKIHLFNRSEHPVQVFGSDGSFERSWGEGLFVNPHGITITSDDTYWLSDRDAHVVQKFSKEGKLLMTLGIRGVASDTGYSDAERIVKKPGAPFNLPTKVALGSSGEIFVSDGYGNCRVHKFSAEGDHLLSWGCPGDKPGQFNLPHSVWVDRFARVLVCDRENHRVQIFSSDGEYLSMWTGFRQPTDIYVDNDDIVYISELGDGVSILDLDGKLLSRWGGDRSHDPGQFWGAHGIWVCGRGDIYVSEVLKGRRVQKFVREK